MLIEAPYKTGDVVTLKLNSGEELIGKLIEEKEVNGVMKRTLFYTECVNFMQRCPNPLGYQDKESLTTYSIGLLKIINDKHIVPCADGITVLREDEESDPICHIISDLRSTDLVLVPKTQIHPHTGRLADTL